MRGLRGLRGIPGKNGVNYINATEFKDFCINQNKLIELLNHRTSTLEGHLIEIKTDVAWTKKILWAIFATAVTACVGVFAQALFGV